jgi:hypothetical protein
VGKLDEREGEQKSTPREYRGRTSVEDKLTCSTSRSFSISNRAIVLHIEQKLIPIMSTTNTCSYKQKKSNNVSCGAEYMAAATRINSRNDPRVSPPDFYIKT